MSRDITEFMGNKIDGFVLGFALIYYPPEDKFYFQEMRNRDNINKIKNNEFLFYKVIGKTESSYRWAIETKDLYSNCNSPYSVKNLWDKRIEIKDFEKWLISASKFIPKNTLYRVLIQAQISFNWEPKIKFICLEI